MTASADLAIVKTGPANVLASTAIAYHLTVTDLGPSDAAALTVTDTLPAGVAFVSATGTGWTCTNAGNVSVTCTSPALAAGTTAPVIDLVVTAPAVNSTLTNVADVSAATADPDPANNTSTLVTAVGPAADVSLTKTGPATVAPGGTIAYLLTAHDAGPSDATTVSVSDTLPAGIVFVSATGTGWTCTNVGNVSVTCTRPTIGAGTTAPVITVVVTAPAHAATLTNTATVTNAVLDPDPSNNTASAGTVVGAAADLSLVKTGPATVVAGGALAYHLVVTNAGPDAATTVRVVDTLPPGVTFVSASGSGWACSHAGDASVTCTRATLANGATAPTISVVVTAPSSPASLTNSAQVLASTLDPVPDNNSSSAPTEVLAAGGGSGGGPLPHTGASGLGLIPVGLLLLVVGGSLTTLARRRLGR